MREYTRVTIEWAGWAARPGQGYAVLDHLVPAVGTSSAKIPAVTARAERVVQERKITTMRFLVVVSSPPPFPLFFPLSCSPVLAEHAHVPDTVRENTARHCPSMLVSAPVPCRRPHRKFWT